MATVVEIRSEFLGRRHEKDRAAVVRLMTRLKFGLSLTPAFKPVPAERRMDISRFNGLRSQRYVGAFVLSPLGSPDLGYVESPATFKQKGRGGPVAVYGGIRRQAGHVHENQFREP